MAILGIKVFLGFVVQLQVYLAHGIELQLRLKEIVSCWDSFCFGSQLRMIVKSLTGTTTTTKKAVVSSITKVPDNYTYYDFAGIQGLIFSKIPLFVVVVLGLDRKLGDSRIYIT